MRLRLKQILESAIQLENNGTIVSVSGGLLTNTLKYSTSPSEGSIVQYGSNGRIRVSTPSDNNDAVNLLFMRNEMAKLSFPGFIDSKTIFFSQDAETRKYIANLDTRSIHPGNILKLGFNGSLVSTNYFMELVETDSSGNIIPNSGRAVVSKFDQRIGSTRDDIKEITFSIESDKVLNNAKSDLAIITTSSNKNYGPLFSTFAYNENENGRTIVTSGQNLFEFRVNGATSDGFNTTLNMKVLSDTNFLVGSPLSHFEMMQNGSGLISTYSSNDIRVHKGLVLGDTTSLIPGNIRYSSNENHFFGYNGTDWVPLDANSGNSSVSSAIVSSYSVGGINVGDTIGQGWTISDLAKAVFNPLSIVDVKADFGSTAYVDNGGILEAGQHVILDGLMYSASEDMSYAVVSGRGFDQSTQYLYFPNPTYSYMETTETTKEFDVALGDNEWTITGTSASGAVIVGTFKFRGCRRVSYGTGYTDYRSESTVDMDTLLADMPYTVSENFIGTGFKIETPYISGSYFYIAYPAEWGTLNNIFMHGVPIHDAFTFIGSFPYTTISGEVIGMNLYQTNATGAFRYNTKLTFK